MTSENPVIPTIVVYVDGGVIQSIASSIPVRLIVLDADVQGNFEDTITVINGEKVIISDHDNVDVDVEYVSSITKHIELAVSK